MTVKNAGQQRQWVTPNFEKQLLKDALSGVSGNLDTTLGYS